MPKGKGYPKSGKKRKPKTGSGKKQSFDDVAKIEEIGDPTLCGPVHSIQEASKRRANRRRVKHFGF